MARQRILTVEDDPAIRRGVVDALRYAGYDAIEASDGVAGMEMALRSEFDLLLLDLILPQHDGLEILKEVRRVRPTMPVIILTARGDETDRIRGLRDGADDYVVKPFSVKELLARVEAVLRRSAERPCDLTTVKIPGGQIDLKRCEVLFENGDRSELCQRELELVRYLAMNAGRAISRDELLSNVWRISPRGLSTRTVDMQVARLREKLKGGSERPEVILTVRGQGYMFTSTSPEP